MLFHSTFRAELSRYFWATLIILVSIVMTVLLIRTLGQASRGNIDPREVTLVLGYTVLGNMHTIVTMALYIASVATLSRMYADSEMVIWFSSGVSLIKFLKPLCTFAWPFILTIALLALFAWPWSNVQTQYLKDRFEKRSDIERVTPGQFQESNSNKMVFFIEKKQKNDDEATSVFISKLDGNLETITTAKAGNVEWFDKDKFLSLKQGQQTVIDHQTGQVRMTEFNQFKYWLDPSNRQILSGTQSQMLSTVELIRSKEPNHLLCAPVLYLLSREPLIHPP